LEVEAIQYDGMNETELTDFLKKYASGTSITFTHAISGDARATIKLPMGQTIDFYNGDWLVHGVDGSIYPVKKWVFAKTYEAVDSDDTAITWC
jgi:hypothetical protein